MNLIRKPRKKKFEPCLEYHKVEEFIEKKYNIKFSQYEPKKYPNDDFHNDRQSSPYLNFWHWFSEAYDIKRGTFVYLRVLEDLEDIYIPFWVKEILELIYQEFGEEEMKLWVEW